LRSGKAAIESIKKRRGDDPFGLGPMGNFPDEGGVPSQPKPTPNTGGGGGASLFETPLENTPSIDPVLQAKLDNLAAQGKYKGPKQEKTSTNKSGELHPDQMFLTDQQLKQIFKEEGLNMPAFDIKNAILGGVENHWNVPGQEELLSGTNVSQVKAAAKTLKEYNAGNRALHFGFEDAGYHKSPFDDQVLKGMGFDVDVPRYALYKEFNKLSKEAQTDLINKYVEENNSRPLTAHEKNVAKQNKELSIKNGTYEPKPETPVKRKYENQADTVKKLNEEQNAGLTAEEIAAKEKAELDRIKNMADPSGRLQKTLKGGKLGMATGPTIHADVAEAARDFLQGQMKNNNGMVETSYYNGKNVVEEMKYPGYHKVEIKQPNGTTIVMKEHTIGDHTEYSIATMRGNNPIPVSSEGGLKSKPKEWISIMDEIGKGK